MKRRKEENKKNKRFVFFRGHIKRFEVIFYVSGISFKNFHFKRNFFTLQESHPIPFDHITELFGNEVSSLARLSLRYV